MRIWGERFNHAEFTGNDVKARFVAIHYAEEFNNEVVLEILTQPRGVQNREEAMTLSHFFWQVYDATARDYENGKVVLNEANLQHWVERLMNIIGDYLKKVATSLNGIKFDSLNIWGSSRNWYTVASSLGGILHTK
jgi:hypothetical protein